jgi:hypothetical protein
MRILAALAIVLLSLSAMADVNCSRSELQLAVNAYLAAQTAGNPGLMPLVPQTFYLYNMEPSTLRDSIVNEALIIDLHRSLLDEYSCQTYTEMVVTDESHPYAFATRLRVTAGSITELESIVTDEGDWLFNPEVTLARSSAENWSLIPVNERGDRATLEAAGNAYFNQFFSGPNSVYVPWGMPCNRLEGGAYTGNGSVTDTCNVGVPEGMNIVNRRFVTDTAMGATVGLVRFGPNLIPDAHLFRLEHGMIRYVHTLTVCPETGCRFN